MAVRTEWAMKAIKDGINLKGADQGAQSLDPSKRPKP
jgi:hypothetical protein